MSNSVQGVLSVVGRVFLCGIFLASGARHAMDFKGTAGMTEKMRVPQPQIMLAGAIVFLIVGSVSVAIGFKARVGALLLFVFLVLATHYFPDFWNINRDRLIERDKEVAALDSEGIQKLVKKEEDAQKLNFMKNLALAGAMLFIVANGAGPWSVDAYLARKPGTAPAG